MSINTSVNPDALPQPMGEFKPLDVWQAHISEIFYGLRGGRVQDYSQTFASADYRLAHALAADYFSRVCAREKKGVRDKGVRGKDTATPLPPYPSTPLIVHEWGPGNGNLAACFLTHLKAMDKDGLVYPRVRYVLVDAHQPILDGAQNHPDLAPHRERVETLCAEAASLASFKDGTVDRILCNELWNDLPAKLMLRKGNDIEEEYLRPNLHEKRHAAIDDWSGFVRAFGAKNVAALQAFPPFLEDIIWEKEYHKTDWKEVPYRKTITDFLKQIDEHVLVPVNLGAFATLKEAQRVLAPEAAGFSSFDAGAEGLEVINDPEKPCYGLFGGQYSFMVNFALVGSVASYLGIRAVTIETQREFVGRSLGTNVISLMDLLACYPAPRSLQPWEQDRLIIKTIYALKGSYRSPYRRRIEFPIRKETPPDERRALEDMLRALGEDGVPDTVAYVTEEELAGARGELEQLGYHRDTIMAALAMPPQPIDYRHCFFSSGR
ncbi:MAG: SAM-dependent methyltransferase [Nitrospiraceae bacterium]